MSSFRNFLPFNFNVRQAHAAVAPLMAKLVPINSTAESSAINYLKSGGVIAVPTDTVYGLACDGTNPSAVTKLYSIKSRIREKPLALCLSEVSDIKNFALTDHLPSNLLNTLFPGPVTLILRYVHNGLGESMVSNEKIGVRIPDCLFIKNLVQGLGRPLALTSANLSNEPSSTQVVEFSSIWSKLDAVFDCGSLGLNRKASTVVDLSQPGSYLIVRDGVALGKTVDVLTRFGLSSRG